MIEGNGKAERKESGKERRIEGMKGGRGEGLKGGCKVSLGRGMRCWKGWAAGVACRKEQV